MTRQLAGQQRSALGLNELSFVKRQLLVTQLDSNLAIDFTIDSYRSIDNCRDNFRSSDRNDWG
jgi:hypothetical protein